MPNPQIPGDACWPSLEEWSAFNHSISGRLLRNTPVAAPCYPLSTHSTSAACKDVVANFNNSAFQGDRASGHALPYWGQQVRCDVPGGNTTTCALGDKPDNTKRTKTTDNKKTNNNKTQTHNLRLVAKSTGHDIMGRTSAPGSLAIWLRHLRQGVTFMPSNRPSHTCSDSSAVWLGAAISIHGGYTFSDIYAVAAANGAIIVGAGNPDVGPGGILQGGGHSPATSRYGLAADQVLEADVVLADGTRVVASACSNPDLFRSIRGGAGGFGIVTAVTITAFPEATAVSVAVSIIASADTPSFLDAVTALYQTAPSLVDTGLSGYAWWSRHGPSGPNLACTLIAFNRTVADVKRLAAPLAANLSRYNTAGILAISITYPPAYASYSAYFARNADSSTTSSRGGAMTSRLVGKKHLLDTARLRTALVAIAGQPAEQTSIMAGFIGRDAEQQTPDAHTGINPAWRQAYLHTYVQRQWAPTASWAEVEAVHADITGVKGAALTRLASDLGAYINEADWCDPEYLGNFYGGMLEAHREAKARYDPDGLFYCPICVGSESWMVDGEGRICRRGG